MANNFTKNATQGFAISIPKNEKSPFLTNMVVEPVMAKITKIFAIRWSDSISHFNFNFSQIFFTLQYYNAKQVKCPLGSALFKV